MNLRLLPHAILLALLSPLAAWPQVSLSIRIAPPPLPIYVQPPVPGDGYLWTPGYWAWSAADDDYYWVPGTWVMAPTVGVLWTPGYWGFHGGGYRWNVGYWGPHVGFYGGVNYGFGYGGLGYQGGRWDRGHFRYNRSVTNVNTTIVRNVYNAPVTINRNAPRVSFNGGPGGVTVRPTAAQLRVQSARHTDPTPNQVEHERTALTTPTQRASVNRGAPQVAATPKPSAFTAPEAVRARDESPDRADRAADDKATAKDGPAKSDRSPPRTAPERPAAHERPKPEEAAPAAATQSPRKAEQQRDKQELRHKAEQRAQTGARSEPAQSGTRAESPPKQPQDKER